MVCKNQDALLAIRTTLWKFVPRYARGSFSYDISVKGIKQGKLLIQNAKGDRR